MLGLHGSDVLLQIYGHSLGQTAHESYAAQIEPHSFKLAAQCPLTIGKVHLWLIKASCEHVVLAFAWLSADERARADAITTWAARRQFVVARGFLRFLLAQHIGGSADAIVLGLAAGGKPYLDLPESKAIQFNVSHTESAVAIALSADCEIGVDIERVRTDFEWRDVADLVFSDEDCHSLSRINGGSAHKEFFTRWVWTEAALKLKGDGILHAIQERRRGGQRKGHDLKPYSQVWFNFGDDLIGSLAVEPISFARRGDFQ